MTEDLVRFFNKETGRHWTPIFDQYLRYAALPTVELEFDEAAGTVSYRWKADEKDSAMPIRVGKAGAWQTIQPTNEWKKLSTPMGSAPGPFYPLRCHGAQVAPIRLRHCGGCLYVPPPGSALQFDIGTKLAGLDAQRVAMYRPLGIIWLLAMPRIPVLLSKALRALS